MLISVSRTFFYFPLLSTSLLNSNDNVITSIALLGQSQFNDYEKEKKMQTTLPQMNKNLHIRIDEDTETKLIAVALKHSPTKSNLLRHLIRASVRDNRLDTIFA
ncbi:hypothetical protein N9V13_03065 [Betaproteobacteria bacterium]|nr:hypothetical protein [Betaproteobacteria bacterium]